MKALLFGSSGFLGRHFTDAAELRGWSVTRVMRNADVPDAFWFDLDREMEERTIEDHDVAIFLAQSPHYASFPEGAESVLQTNVVGLARALELSRRAEVRRFLYASSGSVYLPSWSEISEGDLALAPGLYAISKRVGEEIVAEWKDYFSSVSLRFFALYGSGQEGKLISNLIQRIQSRQAISLAPTLEKESSPRGFTTTPCHVDDAVDVLFHLADSDFSGPLNVAGPEACGIRDIAEEIGQQLGIEPIFTIVGQPRAGDLVASTARLKKLTGLPSVGLSEGIRRTLQGVG